MHDGLDVVVARAHTGAIHLDLVLVVDAEHDQWMIRGWAVRDNVNQIGPIDGGWLFNCRELVIHYGGPQDLSGDFANAWVDVLSVYPPTSTSRGARLGGSH